ncbi:BAI1-associated 3 [Brachionus plicatilis]|uniref:BAI1-associated 3 n=1 Tax=Brachionus plicatilis TaxID=10195 RepID=A0A3M7SDW8_BRAPC|nr:BAI1-associated 3 [Brachionus plicatilis]
MLFLRRYVEIDLKPKHVFINCEKKSTSVVKKSLNPTYNETFEFQLAERYLSQPGHVIHFTIMDHDIVWTNDFEGEAFLELNSVPRLKGESGDINYKELKYSELMLIRPKDIPSRIIDVLEYRKDQDKTALEFLKERRDKLNLLYLNKIILQSYDYHNALKDKRHLEVDDQFKISFQFKKLFNI